MGHDTWLGGSVEWRTTLMLIILSLVVAGHSTIVQTKFGGIRGFQSRSTKGRPTTYYLGVPYAEPPIGDLRFRNPQPWTRKWNVTYDAMADGNKCIQPDHHGHIIGSEDCLFLNIFIPRLTDKREITEKLPVMVYVHGGAYTVGSSDSRKWSPDHFMDQNVVLVTLNYRLNIMGFFSTESKVAPGNYGLKDIVIALRWVQENIEAFHGDPNSVTLWGHSAGAAAVHTLAFSKNTEGLFHRYIIMGGSIFTPWNVSPKDWIRRTSFATAKIVGCLPQGTENSTVGLRDEECPSEDPFLQLYCPIKDKHSWKLDEEMHIWRGNPTCIYGPVIEEESEEAVLTDHPLATIRKRQFRDIPCIVGVVRDEGLVLTMKIRNALDELKDHFKEYILILTEHHRQMSVSDEYVRAVEEFYFGSNVAGLRFENVTQLVGDALMIWPAYQVARQQFPVMNSSTFFYFFTYEGTFSNTFIYAYDTSIYYGICHGDELEYLMPSMSKKFKMLRRTEDDVKMSNIMTEMLARFAATGVPEAAGTVPWPDYKHAHEYLVLGKGKQAEVTVENNFLPVRMAFWMKLTNDTDVIEDEEAVLPPLLPPEDTSDSSSAQDNKLLVFLLILLIVYQ